MKSEAVEVAGMMWYTVPWRIPITGDFILVKRLDGEELAEPFIAAVKNNMYGFYIVERTGVGITRPISIYKNRPETDEYVAMSMLIGKISAD
jgi:hypothetical protein